MTNVIPGFEPGTPGSKGEMFAVCMFNYAAYRVRTCASFQILDLESSALDHSAKTALIIISDCF